MDNMEAEKIKKRGGSRAGAGRPALAAKDKRTNRTMKAFDDEWDLINRFAALVKHGNKDRCKEFIEKVESDIMPLIE